MGNDYRLNKVSFAGLLVALGIIYGDIGTSPLYVMKSIMGTTPVDMELVYGGISCVFWTLTLQTTIKYVLLTLSADNNGEGGIFSLYALVKKTSPWLIVAAMIGGASLLADGIITPPISIASAIEGLRIINPTIPTIPIVIAIIVFMFAFQRFGTSIVGRSFGPMMAIWFSMLAILGISQIVYHPQILAAVNPYYAYTLLVVHPQGIFLLGAVFLCTTGAEALYSDLGHCGRGNIRVSWIFVKSALLLNYFGQGAWLISQEGRVLKIIQGESIVQELNPFYEIMPSWFLYIGIGISTLAAIIASQALISGSFTLVAEAIRLNLFPKVQVNYPSNAKGQLYIPSINTFLLVGCIGIVLFFRESAAMEAAYGLAITVTMLMTTILMVAYLRLNKFNVFSIVLFALLYLMVEGAFLFANLSKFMHGGIVTVIIAGSIIFLMWIQLRAHEIKNKLADFVSVRDYLPLITQLSNDVSVPKYATHLVYLSTARNDEEVENKIIYSILQKQPKRADIYWFVHIEVTDEPNTMEYSTNIIAPNDLVRINFYLGFRVQQRMNLFLRKVVEEMISNNEIDVISRYSSLRENSVAGDFRFVLIEETLSYENEMPFMEQFIMNAHFAIKQWASSVDKWFGLDTSFVTTEKVPLLIKQVSGINLVRRVKVDANVVQN
ncbi:potassium transporter Kup [Sphingobacteriales bacterium UPWRP_1]|nr:potassium transporter Kup [Sphingobacteriales bacterium TSM_CSS]PSJ75953.1 potassium transporter Kup [Sphingobacteriales bacterium UPWRP_1]